MDTLCTRNLCVLLYCFLFYSPPPPPQPARENAFSQNFGNICHLISDALLGEYRTLGAPSHNRLASAYFNMITSTQRQIKLSNALNIQRFFFHSLSSLFFIKNERQKKHNMSLCYPGTPHACICTPISRYKTD